MKTRCTLIGFALCALLLARSAHAEVELLPSPLLVVPGQPIELWFHNHLPPDPDHKVLEFHAVARTDTADSFLKIGFDWLTPNGGPELIWSDPIPVLLNQPRQVGWKYVIPYCPPEVSLHLAVEPAIPGTTGGITLIEGVFIHECIPVPEPATIGLLGLAGSTLLMRRRKAV